MIDVAVTLSASPLVLLTLLGLTAGLFTADRPSRLRAVCALLCATLTFWLFIGTVLTWWLGNAWAAYVGVVLLAASVVLVVYDRRRTPAPCTDPDCTRCRA